MKKKLIAGLMALTVAVSAFGLAACNTKDKEEPEGYTAQSVYKKAVDLGYNGTFEEFITLISGRDGRDGRDGKDGTDGRDGRDGKDGEDGENGKDGLGIESIAYNENGEIVITYTDGNSQNLGKPVCEHEYSDTTEILAATCTSVGVGMRECELCGYTDYVYYESIGHGFGNGVTIGETESNIIVLYSCKDCSATEIKLEEPDPEPDPEPLMPLAQIDIMTHDGVLVSNSASQFRVHYGVDLAADENEDVFAVLDGTVEKIEKNLKGSVVTIAHAGGITIMYGYVVPNDGLTVGDTVERGSVIGKIDSPTNNGDESNRDAHLHFQVKKDGNRIDAEEYLGISLK